MSEQQDGPGGQFREHVSTSREDLRRHVTAACRRWKRTWDSTSQLPAQMTDEIIMAADAYALGYARECLAAIRGRDPGDLAGLIEDLAGVTPGDRDPAEHPQPGRGGTG